MCATVPGLWMELRALCMLDKRSVNRTVPPSPGTILKSLLKEFFDYLKEEVG